MVSKDPTLKGIVIQGRVHVPELTAVAHHLPSSSHYFRSVLQGQLVLNVYVPGFVMDVENGPSFDFLKQGSSWVTETSEGLKE